MRYGNGRCVLLCHVRQGELTYSKHQGRIPVKGAFPFRPAGEEPWRQTWWGHGCEP